MRFCLRLSFAHFFNCHLYVIDVFRYFVSCQAAFGILQMLLQESNNYLSRLKGNKTCMLWADGQAIFNGICCPCGAVIKSYNIVAFA